MTCHSSLLQGIPHLQGSPSLFCNQPNQYWESLHSAGEPAKQALDLIWTWTSHPILGVAQNHTPLINHLNPPSCEGEPANQTQPTQYWVTHILRPGWPGPGPDLNRPRTRFHSSVDPHIPIRVTVFFLLQHLPHHLLQMSAITRAILPLYHRKTAYLCIPAGITHPETLLFDCFHPSLFLPLFSSFPPFSRNPGKSSFPGNPKNHHF